MSICDYNFLFKKKTIWNNKNWLQFNAKTLQMPIQIMVKYILSPFSCNFFYLTLKYLVNSLYCIYVYSLKTTPIQHFLYNQTPFPFFNLKLWVLMHWTNTFDWRELFSILFLLVSLLEILKNNPTALIDRQTSLSWMKCVYMWLMPYHRKVFQSKVMHITVRSKTAVKKLKELSRQLLKWSGIKF